MQQSTDCNTRGQPETDDVDIVFGYKGMAHCSSCKPMQEVPAEDALSCTKSTDRPMLRSSS